MQHTQQILKWGFERAMPVISAYWAMLIAKSERIPVNASVAKILADNPDYISDRVCSRKYRNSKFI